MTSNMNTPERHRQVQEHEVDQIMKAVWETAARRNPMVLMKMVDQNTAVEHLRRMISDCLAKGLRQLRLVITPSKNCSTQPFGTRSRMTPAMTERRKRSPLPSSPVCCPVGRTPVFRRS
jgi:hypothetical protein